MAKEGFIDACYSLIEAFPEVEKPVMVLIQRLLTREITTSVFSKKILQIVKEETEKNIEKIFVCLDNDGEALALARSIFDCVRYKTLTKDAAIAWEADERFLKLMLNQLPDDINKRLECLSKLQIIEVKKKVKTKRECL